MAIQPADVRLQPDNSVDPSKSPFINLPDDCFLVIFNYCDFHTLAVLSTVCKRLSELLCSRVFAKIPKFNTAATSDTEVAVGLMTVSRLVECANPSNFHLKIARNLRGSVEWPEISVDMESAKSEISIEMDFFNAEWMSQLEKIEARVKSIHIHRSAYDSSSFDEEFSNLSFSMATKLTISGFARGCSIPDLSEVVCALPQVEMISLRNGNIDWDHVVSYCAIAKKLQNIKFENCSFDSNLKNYQICEIAKTVIENGNHFPLCVAFDRIHNGPQTVTASVKDGLCDCPNIYCPRHSFCTRSAKTDKYSCGCRIVKCTSCGWSSSKKMSATATMTFNTKEESTYSEILEVRLF